MSLSEKLNILITKRKMDMSINFYLFSVAFYMLSALCIYICIRRMSSQFLTRKRKTINKLNLAACLVVYLGAVGLATFAFIYLQNQQLTVVHVKFCEIGIGI
jgi:hypothetical protein